MLHTYCPNPHDVFKLLFKLTACFPRQAGLPTITPHTNLLVFLLYKKAQRRAMWNLCVFSVLFSLFHFDNLAPPLGNALLYKSRPLPIQVWHFKCQWSILSVSWNVLNVRVPEPRKAYLLQMSSFYVINRHGRMTCRKYCWQPQVLIHWFQQSLRCNPRHCLQWYLVNYLFSPTYELVCVDGCCRACVQT